MESRSYALGTHFFLDLKERTEYGSDPCWNPVLKLHISDLQMIYFKVAFHYSINNLAVSLVIKGWKTNDVVSVTTTVQLIQAYRKHRAYS